MNNSRKKLSSQFTRINLVMASIIIILGASALWVNTILTEYMHYYNPTLNDIETLYAQISSGETDLNWTSHNMPEESYGEILDQDYRVLSASKDGHKPGYQYSVRVFNELVNDMDTDMMIFYPYEDNREMMVLFMPLRDLVIPYQATFISMFLFALGSLCIVYIISTFSAKQIIHPIEKLSHAVHKIREGAYGTRVQLGADNDLDALADDINELSLAIENEIRLREDLEKSRQQLILDISHDLKTPLTNIIGYSESLSTSNVLSETERTYLGAIQRNGKRANYLLNDLFNYSKLNAAHYTLDLHQYDIRFVLEDFIAGCIPDIEAAHKKYQVFMDHVYGPELNDRFLVQLDLQNFRRILHNLVDNFIHHSGEGSEITFKLSYNTSNNETDNTQSVVIDIKDNGIGINETQREHIFDPFYRSDASRSTSTGGSGLGLSITQKIIHLHGGSIDLLPSSKGTHFRITLPKNP